MHKEFLLGCNIVLAVVNLLLFIRNGSFIGLFGSVVCAFGAYVIVTNKEDDE
jgi:ABC-type lipoprotein release transport system permease subunit